MAVNFNDTTPAAPANKKNVLWQHSGENASAYYDEPIPLTYLDTDGTLAANSDAKVPSQQAVKEYVDALAALRGIIKGIRVVSGTTDTPTTADKGYAIQFTNAGAITLTIPTNAAQAFPVGTSIYILQWGAGQVTITPDTGVTLRKRSSTGKTAAQYALATLLKVDTNEWHLSGDCEA